MHAVCEAGMHAVLCCARHASLPANRIHLLPLPLPQLPPPPAHVHVAAQGDGHAGVGVGGHAQPGLVVGLERRVRGAQAGGAELVALHRHALPKPGRQLGQLRDRGAALRAVGKGGG